MQPLLTPADDWLVILPVILPLIAAALLIMLRAVREFHWLAAVAVVLAVLCLDLELFRQALVAGPVSMTMGNWLPPFGISFTADATGAGFAATAAFVTLVVILYVAGDAKAGGAASFYPLVLLLLAGVSGAFLTGDMFNLYVWFEVMLIASLGLMVQASGPLQLDGMVKYGFLNFLATTFFLLALGLLYGLLGTLNMTDIMRVARGANGAAMAGVAALLLLAFGMKAAAFPVNAWLPASYHTPNAAISALFAGLLTKVGVYALLRALVMLLPASREILEPVLIVLAILTLLLAPLGAIAETNLRRALGFMVIGGIGATLLGIALPNPNGIAGAVAYIFHAMLTMTGLYLAAGIIEKATGAVDTRQMGGLYAANAPLSIVFLVLIMAAAGVPPFLGFWPKLLLLEAGLDASGLVAGKISWWALALSAALLINALLTLFAGIRLWSHIFWRAGHEGDTSEAPNPDLRPLDRRQNWLGLGATAVLTLAVMLAGLLPGMILDLGRSAAVDLADPAPYAAATGLAESNR